MATDAHLPIQVGEAALQTAVQVARGEPFQEEVLINFQMIDRDNIALDPGWSGQYEPSFSTYFFPEQLDVLLGESAE